MPPVEDQSTPFDATDEESLRGPMSERQREFFTALCKPFDGAQVKHRSQSGRSLSYITNRTLFNRLDNVAGPTNWYTEYAATANGFTCKLWINVPDVETTNGFRWMFKADGGGFAGMAEADNNEKSGYSDAAKRAGMVWGIARHLYPDGVPDYLGDAAPAAQSSAAPARQAAAPAQAQTAAPQRQAAAAAGGAAPQRQGPPQRQAAGGAPAQGGGDKQYDNFAVPKVARGVYAWAKKLEEHFRAPNQIIAELNAVTKEFDYPYKSSEWEAEQIMYGCWAIVDVLKTWPGYAGEFDHLADPRNPQ